MILLGIAEDNVILSHMLSEKLSNYKNISIRFVVKNGLELIENLKKEAQVDVILMDLEMPLINGIQATDYIKIHYPSIKIIIHTIHDDDNNIFEVIKAGAESYITKQANIEAIYNAITETLHGGSVITPSIAKKAIQFLKNTINSSHSNQNKSNGLSEREIEILQLIAKGLTNKKVADQLYISSFTVKRHIENIYKKLQAQNRIELIDKAKNQKLL